MDARIKAFIRETLQIADDNVAAAQLLFESGEDNMRFRRMITTNQQQAIELYLKAFLAFHDVDFPRTHDLDKLLKKCIGVGPLDFSGIEVGSLDKFGMRVRYADQMELPEREDIVRNTALAEEVGQLVKGYIQPRLEG